MKSFQIEERQDEVNGQLTLVVDDSGELKRAFERALTANRLEHKVEMCSSETALGKVEDDKIEVVICDWRMPGISGIELLTRVRELSPSTRCILITGFLPELQQEKEELPEWIEIYDKTEIDTLWLLEVIGGDDEGGREQEITSLDDFHQDRDEFSSPADKIASQRLELETMKGEKERVEEVVRALTLDLIEDLKTIGAEREILGMGDKKSTVGELISEIEHLTPKGRRLIELDRAVRQRLLDSNTSRFRVKARV